ncbi:hypothetical protein CEE44_00975 [Candidatus Woesearchaeota archaeon B3_Woes]|nr:MAG: hypothetical protein CEE44_00975 [Candidatus Woesearchaeota archaeon B3_Woes]
MNAVLNPVDLNIALHRALGSVFTSSDYIIRTFEDILKSYPLKRIESMKQGELEKVLYRLSQRKGVQEMQESINTDIQHGQEKIDSAVYGIILQNLENAGIISKDELSSVNDFCDQEIVAYSCPTSQDPNKVLARGQFPLEMSLDEARFTPNNVFYSGEGLEWKIRPGEKPNLILEEGAMLKEGGRFFVFEEQATTKRSHQIVREITQYLVDHYPAKEGLKNNYPSIQKKLVRALRPMFPSVEDEEGRINHQKLVKIFRQAKRRNIDLNDYVKQGDRILTETLMKSIEEIVPAPYSAVKTRVKSRETAFHKIIESIYDLRSDGHKGGAKEFKDLYGIRIILPTIDDIFVYVNQLKRSAGVEVVTDREGNSLEKDHVTFPKPNKYQSYHLPIKFAGTLYDIQIRTHEMDEKAERDIQQAHHVYKNIKKDPLDSTSLNVRKVISTCLGLPLPCE